MKTRLLTLLMLVAITCIVFNSCSEKEDVLQNEVQKTGNRLKSVPANPNNLVAYYAFDATPSGQGKLRLNRFHRECQYCRIVWGIHYLSWAIQFIMEVRPIISLPLMEDLIGLTRQIIEDIHTLTGKRYQSTNECWWCCILAKQPPLLLIIPGAGKTLHPICCID